MSEADKIYQDIVMGKWNFKIVCEELGIKQLEEYELKK